MVLLVYTFEAGQYKLVHMQLVERENMLRVEQSAETTSEMSTHSQLPVGKGIH